MLSLDVASMLGTFLAPLWGNHFETVVEASVSDKILRASPDPKRCSTFMSQGEKWGLGLAPAGSGAEPQRASGVRGRASRRIFGVFNALLRTFLCILMSLYASENSKYLP